MTLTLTILIFRMIWTEGMPSMRRVNVAGAISPALPTDYARACSQNGCSTGFGLVARVSALRSTVAPTVRVSEARSNV
jgi:hypothetical protein